MRHSCPSSLFDGGSLQIVAVQQTSRAPYAQLRACGITRCCRWGFHRKFVVGCSVAIKRSRPLFCNCQCQELLRFVLLQNAGGEVIGVQVNTDITFRCILLMAGPNKMLEHNCFASHNHILDRHAPIWTNWPVSPMVVFR